jgi:transcriptional regulator with XRE-family HTH domain
VILPADPATFVRDVSQEDRMPTAFGEGLRDWRRRRDMSQMRLGLVANVSARHIAFLETGRANPTRGMVLRLADALEVPRTERNGLLEAAGFAAAYARRDLASHDMTGIRDAMTWTLDRHAPYPGFAIDRHWVLQALNAPAERLLGALGIGVGASLLEALTTPGPFRDTIENWPDVARHMALRLRTEARHAGGDAVLEEGARRLIESLEDEDARPGLLPAVLTSRLRVGDQTLAFFSTIAQFGSAEDIAIADLRIELLFPLDAATRSVLEGMARSHAS